MGQGLFITGTDTGVGKTLVTCGLASLLRAQDYRVGVMKPVETGCAEKDGALYPQDASFLKEAAGSEEPMEEICPYRFHEPLAPSVAAAKTHTQIEPDRITKLYRKISSDKNLTLVEGAGGLMVPLGPSTTYADLALHLKLPLLVVVANRLGAINHAILTLEHARCKGLHVLGYVLNHLEQSASPASRTNAETLRSLTSVPCLGDIPYLTQAVMGFVFESNRSLLVSHLQGTWDLAPLSHLLSHNPQ